MTTSKNTSINKCPSKHKAKQMEKNQSINNQLINSITFIIIHSKRKKEQVWVEEMKKYHRYGLRKLQLAQKDHPTQTSPNPTSRSRNSRRLRPSQCQYRNRKFPRKLSEPLMHERTFKLLENSATLSHIIKIKIKSLQHTNRTWTWTWTC